MKLCAAVAAALLLVFTIAWTGWTYANYQVFVMSDCHMDQTGEMAAFCDAYLKLQPQLIGWRWLAVEGAAILAFLLFRKFACSRKS